MTFTEAEEAYVEYCRTHGGAQTGVAGFRAGYEIGKALGAEAASPTGGQLGPGTPLDTSWNKRASPPGGEWRWVPVEPTKEMLVAAGATPAGVMPRGGIDRTRRMLPKWWSAMLSAAPPHLPGGEWQGIDTASQSQPSGAEVEPLPPVTEPSAACVHLHQPPWDGATGRYVSGPWTCQFCGHQTEMFP